MSELDDLARASHSPSRSRTYSAPKSVPFVRLRASQAFWMGFQMFWGALLGLVCFYIAMFIIGLMFGGMSVLWFKMTH